LLLPDLRAIDTRYGLPCLDRFYRVHARLYDWTRPFLLFGRRAAVAAVEAGPGLVVLDVGSGTGWNLAPLVRSGASVVAIECSPPMLERCTARAARLTSASIRLDSRPYGTHADHVRAADRILFSYSLSMIPPFRDVLERAGDDLRTGGRIVVLDFLDAAWPVAQALAASHVFLGPERLAELRRLFPRHQLDVTSVGLWRYFLFVGER
jgi:S-adenosylmethionine-diacylgycerolhomoserine-N-methlytransferase